MKKLIHKKYGSADLLSIQEVEKSSPKDDEILIKVLATTVNRTDCAMLKARPSIMRLFTGLLKPSKSRLGTDFAGIIEDVGKDIVDFKIDDRVFGFNDIGIASHAEYICISSKVDILKIPENISFEQATASIEGAHYATNFINKFNLKKGQQILVNGATGAIGSAMVQLLATMEIKMTAVCSGDKIELVKSLGAQECVNYLEEDFTKLNRKFDFVFDAVGKSSFNKVKPILKSGGSYVSSELGWMAQNLFYSLRSFIFKKLSGNKNRKKVIFPYPTNIKISLELVCDLMEKGRFDPLIDRFFEFDAIADAYNYVERGEKIGNVVICHTPEQKSD